MGVSELVQHCRSLETLRCGGDEGPREALPDDVLDEAFVKEIDPKTWVVSGVVQKPAFFPLFNELPIAEKFRLAFAERDARLALNEQIMQGNVNFVQRGIGWC